MPRHTEKDEAPSDTFQKNSYISENSNIPYP